jgi:hypothetical protein
MEKLSDVQDIRVQRQKFEIATGRLVCLNFKVPMRIRQQFKIYAARHNMTMTDLLLHLLRDCLASDTPAGQSDKEITI